MDLTPRQVLNWTEKGLIQPIEPARKAGSTRGYDFVNLVEFGLCKVLFDELGLQFYQVKGTLDIGRKRIRRWAEKSKNNRIPGILSHFSFGKLFSIGIKEELKQTLDWKKMDEIAVWSVNLGRIRDDIESRLQKEGYA